ncbi:hypothetical protein [Defluviimonas salinarum]|uniref:hypothetical protein n=1 Tax=Defluviimonas salinarum TaxID=2992147 RepID=UPI00222E1A6B|nr:hypothetical protein [Defluviimonas salinarum]
MQDRLPSGHVSELRGSAMRTLPFVAQAVFPLVSTVFSNSSKIWQSAAICINVRLTAKLLETGASPT